MQVSEHLVLLIPVGGDSDQKRMRPEKLSEFAESGIIQLALEEIVPKVVESIVHAVFGPAVFRPIHSWSCWRSLKRFFLIAPMERPVRSAISLRGIPSS